MNPSLAYQMVHDELLLDGNSRQNLATFCQTWVEPEVHRLMAECLDKNIVDRDEYPQMAEFESRCVHMLADLWHAPLTQNSAGCSSEAGILAGLALKTKWAKKRKVRGEAMAKPNLVCGPVQVASPGMDEGIEETLVDVDIDGFRYLLIRLPKSTAGSVKISLSPREREIVRMVAQGHPNKVIAGVLNISGWTVCTHLRRIFAKLNVGSRAAMVARLLEMGAVDERIRAVQDGRSPQAVPSPTEMRESIPPKLQARTARR